MGETLAGRRLLQWYLEAGVDETIQDEPVDRYAVAEEKARYAVAEEKARPATARPGPGMADGAAGSIAAPMPAAASRPIERPPIVVPSRDRPTPGGDEAVRSAVALAQAADSVAALRQALLGFDGCALAKTATNLVLCDGNPEAAVMFVGEAPGAEEDRQGLPFVGASGKLLDRMLASIGLDRTRAFISNTVFWRPPGNRTPTTQEMAICMPFLERLIELVGPRFLVTLGGPAAKSVLAESAGVSKLRGRWFSYSTPRLPRPIPATALYHPAYLLRSPAQKRDTWRDLLALKKRLETEAE